MPQPTEIGFSRRPASEDFRRGSLFSLMAWVFLGLGSALVVLLAVDFLLLRGETVVEYRALPLRGAQGSLQRDGNSALELTVPIDRVGEEHVLVLSTHPRKAALGWTLVSPEGWEVSRGRDILMTERHRVVYFSPPTQGDYTLRLELLLSAPDHMQSALARRTPTDQATVIVRVNDRSILIPLFQRRNPFWWPRS